MFDSFLENGWRFPIGLDARGGIALSNQEDDIEQSIRIILETAPGERVMRPEFGCGLHNLVFAPNSPATAGLVDHQVRTALDRWEPRIDVIQVQVRQTIEDPAVLWIDIEYRLQSNQETRQTTYAFHRLPEER